MKPLIVDSLAAVLFFTLLAGLNELVVAGMSWSQVITARLAAIPVILATGRPYGLWRDAVFRRVGAHEAEPGSRTRAAVDILAFLTFQVPVYVAILTLAGAETGQMARAVPTAVAAMILVSRPYGLYLESCRRLAGLAPSGDRA